jgi:hypothetical protein
MSLTSPTPAALATLDNGKVILGAGIGKHSLGGEAPADKIRTPATIALSRAA